MNRNRLGIAITAATLSALMLTGCGGSSSGGDDEQEVTREHDTREFTVPPQEELEFADVTSALSPPSTDKYYGVYEGLQGPAAYAVEIPEGWTGGLVMYTHGYRGTGEALGGQVPNDAWRAAVLGAGYAWAGSSYSANYYDVRAAIEDTNKLALGLVDYIEEDFGTTISAPQQILISGYSLGGHTAAAAVDRENMEQTRHPVDYQGALPFCQAEQNQFQWLGDYSRVVQELSGFGDEPYEEEVFQQNLPSMLANLFKLEGDTFTWEPANEAGERVKAIAMNLTGGERPIFGEYGFANEDLQFAVLGSGGSNGDINGILARNIYDNTDRVYRWTSGESPNASEQEFNETIMRVAADSGVNPMRDDGVRWLPLVQGDFDVPVMTLHTLGDFYVPFRHQQLYREGAIENGNEDLLVQRAIRAPGHCDFTPSETITAMTEFLLWVNDESAVPEGDNDDILDPAALAADDFGCEFSDPARDEELVGVCTAD